MNFTYTINSYDKIRNMLNVTYTHLTHGIDVVDITLQQYDMPQDLILEQVSANAPYVKWKQLEESSQVEAEKMVGMTGESTFKMPIHAKVSIPVSRPPAAYEGIREEFDGYNTAGIQIYKSVLFDLQPQQIILKKARIVTEKTAMIKYKRDQIKISGVKVGEKWFHTDADSRIQFLGLIGMGANIAPNLQWKTMDGAFVTMTPTLAMQVFAATAQLDIQVFGIAELHIQALKAAEDPNMYNYELAEPTWPAIFVAAPSTSPTPPSGEIGTVVL